MRVLMTSDTVGGVWNYALGLARAVRSRDVEIALLTAGAPLSGSQRRQLAALPHVEAFETDHKLEWMHDPWDDVGRTGDRLERLARDWRADVVHLNGYAYGRRRFGVPVLTVGHSCVLSWYAAVKGAPAPADWDRYRHEVTLGLAAADLVVAPTAAMLHSLETHYGPLAATRVIPNGRDAAAFAPGPKKDAVLTAGRVWDEAKNLATLARVAARLPWPVRVAGDVVGPDATAAAFDGVDYLGHLDEPALAAEMAAAAVFAMPARYEPFGLAILEAALCGCALVLGDVPSLREVWGDAAVYVRPDDADALHAALTTLMTSPPARAHFAAAARTRARRYADPDATAAAYVEAYEGLAAANPRSEAAGADAADADAAGRRPKEAPCVS